ncbi:hypothetical protein Q3G72_003882 [Acer saccharum]|nr:hypothetical protein Q3G72_003882 [Acer saccharum]
MKAQPMKKHLAQAIDEGCIGLRVDPQPQVMSEKFEWDTNLDDSQAQLMELVYLVEFHTLQEAFNTISSIFDNNRGKVLNVVMRPDIKKWKGLKEHMIPLSKYEDRDKDKI